VHFLVSQPALQRVFNYEPTYNAFDTPEPYLQQPANRWSEGQPHEQLILPGSPGN
jgi:hypothetical protein